MRIIRTLALITAAGAAAATVGCSASSSPAGAPNANEIALTSAMKRDVGALLRARGFNCPEPKLAFAQGSDAYGSVVKLYCGPADRDGVFEKALFRVTFAGNDRILTSPWQ